MATPKRLNFSSPSGGGGGDADDTSPSSRRKSLRKSASKRATSCAVTKEEPKKKKNMIWSEEDELAILKGLGDYRAKTGHGSNTDWDAFFHFVQGSIHAKVTRDQLVSKIRKLKRKFVVDLERINGGNDPLFTRSRDSEAFGFAMMIWGQNDADFANRGIDKVQQIESVEDEEAANAEPVNDNGGAKSYFDGDSLQELVDKITENRTVGEESDDNGAAKSNFDGNTLQEVVVDKVTENRTVEKENHDDGAAKSNFVGKSLEEVIGKVMGSSRLDSTESAHHNCCTNSAIF